MLDSEKLAIAAHLHVLLRRKAGRVTDIEWMVSSTEYAREIIRFTRQKAVEDSHADLADWADKLELAFFGAQTVRPAAAVAPVPVKAPGSLGGALRSLVPVRAPVAVTEAAPESLYPAGSAAEERYIGRLR